MATGVEIIYKSGASVGYIRKTVQQLMQDAPPGFIRLESPNRIQFISLDEIAKFTEIHDLPDVEEPTHDT